MIKNSYYSSNGCSLSKDITNQLFNVFFITCYGNKCMTSDELKSMSCEAKRTHPTVRTFNPNGYTTLERAEKFNSIGLVLIKDSNDGDLYIKIFDACNGTEYARFSANFDFSSLNEFVEHVIRDLWEGMW